jgi:hypothetical protein
MRDGLIHILSTTYTKEGIRKYQVDFGAVHKCNILMDPKCHPEMDNTPLLPESGIKQFQRIIGVCQWLIVSGRFDLCYAITSFLSRYSSAPQEDHLAVAHEILGHLRK